MEPQLDLTASPGMGVCDRCERIKPLGWFGAFWLCDECTLRGIDALGADALGRCIERFAKFAKGQADLLDRALEIIESAYACPEWVQWNGGRTERTDETMELIVNALGPLHGNQRTLPAA